MLLTIEPSVHTKNNLLRLCFSVWVHLQCHEFFGLTLSLEKVHGSHDCCACLVVSGSLQDAVFRTPSCGRVELGCIFPGSSDLFFIHIQFPLFC